ncbi:PD-(D/E)XK nuclease family protein [Mesomycoplasma moatsii]
MKSNNKYLFNKIFAGKYINFNLGHELKNFIVSDEGIRYVYVNPWGRINKEKSKNIEYIIHIIENSNIRQNMFEIVAISEIDKNSNHIIKKDPQFQKIDFHKIFDVLFYENSKTKNENFNISFIANNFYIPKKDKRIYIEIKKEKSNIELINKNEVVLSMNFNFGRSLFSYPKNNDEIILENFFKQLDIWFDLSKTNNSYKTIPKELPFCVISGRVSLELSVSNLLAYFLERDQNLLNKFLKDFLNINIDEEEKFEIKREEKNIDILIISQRRIIVIENKIYSHINGIKNKNESQLNRYFEYVNSDKKYKDLEKHFYLLIPEYSSIEKEFITNLKYGKEYMIVYYKNFYEILKSHQYLKSKNDDYQKFIFNEFRQNIKYLTWTKAQQVQYTSFIKLKQKIEFLKQDKID